MVQTPFFMKTSQTSRVRWLLFCGCSKEINKQREQLIIDITIIQQKKHNIQQKKHNIQQTKTISHTLLIPSFSFTSQYLFTSGFSSSLSSVSELLVLPCSSTSSSVLDLCSLLLWKSLVNLFLFVLMGLTASSLGSFFSSCFINIELSH